MSKYIFLAFLSISFGINAVEIEPFPQARITVEQWQKYFGKVSNEFGDTKKIYEEQNLVVFSNDQLRANIAFTTENHAAHPAWVTRYVTQNNDSVNIAQIGYFAGEEAPFAKLFNEYAKLNDRVKERLKLENSSVK
ncbi:MULTISPECIES: hypothetical protein [unclassified Arsukibacterium]|uniref:hypothetical protein n=1 Tax=unclassified Arsukibacterium TaxID=2635278 RepID=UPI000C5AB5CC|nr:MULTISPECIES: hypothetical protein [unclassified Arsukibacterium]MAA96194.1 hypothetical protein [Rheinheimera sp.]MBM32931.1 hypothetical protein [Rheinheimera sp.]HAW92881.1 hypothetical protein [Candidatus Azambacteria bacterium]|tara:strand:- start:1017 stop:1424 length:408 start_codon:yes stop_codon:yes gene_type:complete